MDKRKGCLWLMILLLILTISPLAYAGESQPRVQSVLIQAKFPKGKEVHSTIEKRICESFEKVANKLLVGQEVLVIQKTRKEIGEVMKTVFNRVLRGFEVTDVGMVVGEQTAILIQLQPTSLLIEEVNFDLHLIGLSEQIVQVVDQELASITRVIENLFIGLPVDALGWADDLIEPMLIQVIRWQLPGFEPEIDLEMGTEIKVDLTLRPEGELVQDIQVDVRTHSLPQLLVSPLEEKIEDELVAFYGLPVKLLNKYQDRVLNIIEDQIKDSRWSNYVYLTDQPKIHLGKTTDLTLNIDWLDYQFDFVGELNVAHDAPDPALHLALSRMVWPLTKLEVKSKITLNRLIGNWSIGLERQWNEQLTSKVAYQIQDANWLGGVEWKQGNYGVTVSQTIPGGIENTQLAVNYYPRFNTKVSLVQENRRFWISLQQRL